jgi:peptidylprolyl isomerase
MKKRYLLITVLFVLGMIALSGCGSAPAKGGASNGDVVRVDYTGTLEDGTVFDTSLGREPIEFTLGAGEMIPGFEEAVLGMEIGETKTFTIPPEEAYGPRYDELIMEVPLSDLPEGLDPEVGQQLQSTRSDGQMIIVTVVEISETSITVDANHPLAGKDLTFEIELVSIL